MSETKTLPLFHYADFINGYAFKPTDWEDEGLPIIRIQNLNDNSKPFNRTTKKVNAKYLVKKGDLLVSWSASLGAYTWDRDENGLLNQHIFKVFPKGNTDLEFLRFAILDSLQKMTRFLQGATMQHIKRGDFLNIQVPALNIDEQKIFAKKRRLQELIEQKRKRQRELLRLIQKSHPQPKTPTPAPPQTPAHTTPTAA